MVFHLLNKAFSYFREKVAAIKNIGTTGGKMEALTQRCPYFPSKVKGSWKFFWLWEVGMRGG